MLGCLLCLANRKKRANEREIENNKNIRYKRIQNLPFVWKLSIKKGMENNVDKNEKINNFRDILHSSAKKNNLLKEICERVKRIE
jgi:hypothetical protein